MELDEMFARQKNTFSTWKHTLDILKAGLSPEHFESRRTNRQCLCAPMVAIWLNLVENDWNINPVPIYPLPPTSSGLPYVCSTLIQFSAKKKYISLKSAGVDPPVQKSVGEGVRTPPTPVGDALGRNDFLTNDFSSSFAFSRLTFWRFDFLLVDFIYFFFTFYFWHNVRWLNIPLPFWNPAIIHPRNA